MIIHLVTFSDSQMTRSRDLCVESAKRNGADFTFAYDEFLLRCTSTYIRNRDLFSASRGIGYWAWKPYFIEWILRFARLGEFVIYSDAGVEFIAPVSYIINRMDQDIFLFGNNWEHAHWCKRDVIEAIFPMRRLGTTETGGELFAGKPWGDFGKQVQASVIFFRVSNYTRAFVKEWLEWCLFEGGRLIDDSPSRLPNHPEFQEHRHDQAILTTMAYREGIRLHYWPAVYNRCGSPEFIYEKLPEYADDNYPILFHHHRRRDHEWK